MSHCGIMKEKVWGCKSCVSFVWNCEDWRSWRDAPDELSVKSDRDEFRHRYHSSVGKHIRLAGDAGRNRYVHRVALIAIGSSYLLQYIVRSQRHGLRCCLCVVVCIFLRGEVKTRTDTPKKIEFQRSTNFYRRAEILPRWSSMPTSSHWLNMHLRKVFAFR